MRELEEENKKTGLFDDRLSIALSYPIGMPILDQQLGAIYRFREEDGSITEQKQIGLQAGTFTMIVGPSSSGKSTMAEQIGYNIVEPFGEDAIVIHVDAEKAAIKERVRTILGLSEQEFSERYKFTDIDTWEKILRQIITISEKKQSDPNRYMYDTGLLDFKTGKMIRHYIPTVVIIDSLMAVTSEHEDVDDISGLTAGGREAIYRGKFYRNAVRYTTRYNINVIVVNHYDDEMPSIGMAQAKSKELPFIPTGKQIPGGKKSKYYTNAIILCQPIAAKDGIKTAKENGYNGLPVKTLVIKSRTSIGGTVALQEFVQEAGFDPNLTLMNLAKDCGVISGRNPSCYFTCNPEVKFDTRKFVEEMGENPEIIRTLYREMRPILDNMIPIIDTTSEDNVLNGEKSKKENRHMMRELLYS